MRLAAFIASSGEASRRQAEKLIAEHRVVVNGLTATDPALGVTSEDDVRLDGRRLELLRPEDLTYIAFHKPIGVVSTMAVGREKGPSITDVLALPERIFPVGRLDQNSSGLLLLTDDGNLAYRLLHPKHKVIKEYLVKLNRPLQPRDYDRIVRGIPVEGRVVEIDGLQPAAGDRWRITIHEGRKHIVRRLFVEIRCRVVELKRTRIGPISLGRLPVGKWRKLTADEINRLRSLQ